MAKVTFGMAISANKQPTRWRRMLVLPHFVLQVIKERLNKY